MTNNELNVKLILGFGLETRWRYGKTLTNGARTGSLLQYNTHDDCVAAGQKADAESAYNLKRVGLPPEPPNEPYPCTLWLCTHIDKTWVLIEALAAKGMRLVLEDWREHEPGSAVRGWSAYFDLPGGHTSSQKVAPTAPMAICLAALELLPQPASPDLPADSV